MRAAGTGDKGLYTTLGHFVDHGADLSDVIGLKVQLLQGFCAVLYEQHKDKGKHPPLAPAAHHFPQACRLSVSKRYFVCMPWNSLKTALKVRLAALKNRL